MRTGSAGTNTYTQVHSSVHKTSACNQLSAASTGTVINQLLERMCTAYRLIDPKVVVGHS